MAKRRDVWTLLAGATLTIAVAVAFRPNRRSPPTCASRRTLGRYRSGRACGNSSDVHPDAESPERRPRTCRIEIPQTFATKTSILTERAIH